MFYVMWYNGMSGGSCEEMQDMEWCERIEEKDIGTMTIVKAEVWDRQSCSGGNGGGHDFAGPP